MFVAAVILCTLLSVEVSAWDYNATDVVANKLATNRTGRFIGWWLGIGVGVVRFENAVCTGANGLTGICYTRRQCTTVGGYGSGRCARVGVCCIVQATCGATSSNNNTYFSNPGFPNTLTGANTCTLTIQRCSADICQVRIDLLSLILAQPDGDGVCVNDALFITGGASPIGRICGQNTGQHIYVDFNNGNNIDITIVTSALATVARQWNIRVAQISCDSTARAPTGCLMYYTGITGTVSSFNYGPDANAIAPAMASAGTAGTRQLANTNYGICVRMEPGYCSITWSATAGNVNSFSVSGDSTVPSTSADPLTDAVNCMTDYVIIPNGQFTSTTGVSTMADRYCGNVFLPVTTSSKPFVLTTVTDGNEGAGVDVANRGFSLSYAQQPCGNTLMV